MLLHTLGCSCCGEPDDPFATRFTAIGFEQAVVGRVLRSMDDEIADADFEGEPGTQAFAAEEDGLTALLATKVHDAGMKHRHILADAIARDGDNLGRISAAMDDMAAAIGEPWDDETEEQAGELLASAIWKGSKAMAQKAEMGELSQDPQSLNLYEGVKAAARYSTNRFFNNLVIPALYHQAEKLLNEANPLDAPTLAPLLEVLDQRLRSVPYWNIVANAAASRGYHYGIARTAQIRGRTTYRFTAVVDEKTSKVCLYLNGKEFSVSEAVDMMDWIARAETTDEIKRIAPWPKLKDLEGLSNQELEIRGWAVPPMHGRCRSSMVIL